jgi:hypothetical protein
MGMPNVKPSEVGWLNRAAEYYLAARVLYDNALIGPAAFCGYHATELMVKRALVHHDRSFSPRDSGHALAKMVRMVNNTVRPKPALRVPAYFYNQQRLSTVTRYPRHGVGVLIPFSYIDDLDKVFTALARMVPIPRNTQLARAILVPTSQRGRMLGSDNDCLEQLRACVDA